MIACACVCMCVQVGMNPMKLPEGLEEELELLDELGKIYGEEMQQQAAAKLGSQGSLRPVSRQAGLRPVNPVQPLQPGRGNGSTAAGSSSVSRSRRQQRQQQSTQGMHTYSPEEFRKAFNVREEEED